MTQEYGIRTSQIFDGETYDREKDAARLMRAQDRVLAFMSDGQWHLPEEVRLELDLPPGTAITSRIRDLRKQRFGAFTVERRRHADGSGRYEYRLELHKRAAERRQEDVK
jgi:hypothetical protein